MLAVDPVTGAPSRHILLVETPDVSIPPALDLMPAPGSLPVLTVLLSPAACPKRRKYGGQHGDTDDDLLLHAPHGLTPLLGRVLVGGRRRASDFSARTRKARRRGRASGSFDRDPIVGLDADAISRAVGGNGDEEVRAAGRCDIAHHPSACLAGHAPGRIQGVDAQSDVGDPPGQTVVEVSLHGRAAMPAGGGCDVEPKRAVGGRRILGPRGDRPDERSREQRHDEARAVHRSVTALADGRSAALQPPPRAWMSSTAAVILRPRICTAVISLVSAMVCAVITLR